MSDCTLVAHKYESTISHTCCGGPRLNPVPSQKDAARWKGGTVDRYVEVEVRVS